MQLKLKQFPQNVYRSTNFISSSSTSGRDMTAEYFKDKGQNWDQLHTPRWSPPPPLLAPNLSLATDCTNPLAYVSGHWKLITPSWLCVLQQELWIKPNGSWTRSHYEAFCYMNLHSNFRSPSDKTTLLHIDDEANTIKRACQKKCALTALRNRSVASVTATPTERKYRARFLRNHKKGCHG
jgi:hypothetical protein